MNIVLQLCYLSITTELINLVCFALIYFFKSLPYEFAFTLSLFNSIYAVFIFLLALTTKGRAFHVSISIIGLAIMKELFYKNNLILSSIDSLICMFLLIILTQSIERYKSQYEAENLK